MQLNLGNPPTMVGRSSPFRFTVGSLNEPARGISEFGGMSLTRLAWPNPPAEDIFVPEGGEIALNAEDFDPFGSDGNLISVFTEGNLRRIVSVGGHIGIAGRMLRNFPTLCVDGPWYGQPANGFCTSPPRFGLIYVFVSPSPRRPFLDFSRSNSVPALTLRGLPPTRYRLESSTNLHAWTPLGDLTLGETGNASVPPEWVSTNSTQFIRFSPLP